MFNCEECYKQASEQVKGTKGNIEEIGAEVYYFLHYDFNHGNKDKAVN